MSWLSALNPSIALGGVSLLGSYLGQREANQTNRDIASQTTSANMAEAHRNREFQREMSNTAFQRQREDLRAAGLNPLLMSGMSGASTPSGSAGSAVSTSVESTMKGIPDAVQAGIALHNQQLATAKQGAEIGLMRDQQALTKAQAGKAYMETKAISKDIPKSDLINSVYDWGKNKFKQLEQDAAKFENPFTAPSPNIQKYVDPKQQQKRLESLMRLK